MGDRLDAMKPIPFGMVGGGTDAFIGAVHRMAARLDGRFTFVAGALSSTVEKSLISARTLGVERSYGDFHQMALAESNHPDGIKAVVIVTPNHLHFPIARVFLQAGIHVICEKPATATKQQAEQLADLVAASQALFILIHNYSAYPMIRQARSMVQQNRIGPIRNIQVEYAQDWLARTNQNKQAVWRLDPEQAGAGGAIADIGSHAAHLASFVSGLEICEVAADFSSFVSGRNLDDDVRLLLRFNNQARGMLWASQVAVGFDNDIRLRIFGEDGGLDWQHSQPNRLIYSKFGEPSQILTRAGAHFAAHARLPAGHPEGFIEALATLYHEIADTILENSLSPELPGIKDAVMGMRLIDAAVKSHQLNSAWVKIAPFSQSKAG